MKQCRLFISIIFICFLNVSVSAQIEDFLSVNKPMAIDFKDDVMYMVLNSTGGPATDGAIAKVDLNDPDLNIEILVDNLIYPRALHIVDNYLYYALPTSIRRIDITVQNPVPETYVTGAIYVRAFSYKDNFLYLAENGKVSKVDLTQVNPSKVTVVDGLTSNPLALEELNNELYIAFGNKISKVDLSDTSPVLIDVLPNLNANPYGMDFYGDYLYIEQTFAVTSGDKKIVKCDLSQNNPIVEDLISYTAGSSIIDLKFHDNDLYIVYGGFGNKIGKLENADTLSIDDQLIREAVTLFPNPANHTISLANLEHNTLYYIFNVNGKMVKSGVVNINESISIEDLNSGFYFLTTDYKNSFKFIKL